MPAPGELYQEVYQQIWTISRPERLRRSTVRRLALLASGIIAAKSAVLLAGGGGAGRSGADGGDAVGEHRTPAAADVERPGAERGALLPPGAGADQRLVGGAAQPARARVDRR